MSKLRGAYIFDHCFPNIRHYCDLHIAGSKMDTHKKYLKIGYSRICACTKIPVFCLLPGPADKNKGSRPSLIAL